MSEQVLLTVKVNGSIVRRMVEPRLSLLDFLRRDLGLTGTHVGCEMGACGACLVSLEGRAVHSCLMLAVQAHDLSVETIEGLSEMDPLQIFKTRFSIAMHCSVAIALPVS